MPDAQCKQVPGELVTETEKAKPRPSGHPVPPVSPVPATYRSAGKIKRGINSLGGVDFP